MYIDAHINRFSMHTLSLHVQTEVSLWPAMWPKLKHRVWMVLKQSS